MVSVNQQGRGRPAKVGHRKSRNGCMKCKSRRVKCDETRPVCGSCSRLQMDCSWPTGTDKPARWDERTRRLTPSPNPPSSYLSPSTASAGSASASASASAPASASASAHSPCSEPAAASYMTNWPRWPSEGDENPFETAAVDSDAGQGMGAGLLPESKARRLLEHRIMQHWYLNFNNPFNPVVPVASWRRLWTTEIPKLGLHYDNVLYGMLATSATNMLQRTSGTDDDNDNDNDNDNDDDNKGLFAARQSYFIAALHAQRQEVARLSVANADAVCFGALLISVGTFAMLKERSLTPYSPPMEWLQLGRGAGTVIWQSMQTIVTQGREADHPALVTMSRSYPYFGKDQSYFSPAMRTSFQGVLTQHLPSGGDDWTHAETREAYEKTISYVGSIQKGINDGEPVYAISRRIQTFALLVPPRFIELLSMQRPRALVILAHFWATVAQVHNVWWLGEAADGTDEDSTAQREIRAIKQVLPQEWMTTMVWPLDQVGLRDTENEHMTG